MGESNHSLRFLLIRAIVTVVVVLTLLLGLRLSGVIQMDQDVPLEAMEISAAEET